MEFAPVTTVSQNGQIVIPDSVRKALNLLAGMKLAVFTSHDTIILKKIDLPSADQAFKELHEWGVKHAKAKGLREAEVIEKIHKSRVLK